MATEQHSSLMRSVRVPSPQRPQLELVETAIPPTPGGTVRIRVEACGVCHSDVLTVQNYWPGITYPRAPGHEIAGTIDEVGDGVIGWAVGDRVGVGWHGGHCGHCERCRRGDFLTCTSLQIPGIAYDGGYADYVVVPVVALARIPQTLSFEQAAPLMCAGVTTFNALRNSEARAGDLVAVLGIGGLGHLGVQYAAKMGFETVAIARGSDKESFARELGAHHYIDSESADVASELKKLGGARVALSTVTAAQAMAPVIDGLGVNGQLVVLGAAAEPLPVNTAPMISPRHSIKGWPSGTNVDSEDTMKFSALTGVTAQIETMPLERTQDAYDRMLSGKARFRMVLTTGR
jgi:D-arabinose 1-dehydrogenase-like Zn-dependent alcohol dehydrogenase